jgi:ornithine cyclodeaminase/alanine dehydrogenase-like protein (mu-crystallin family)
MSTSGNVARVKTKFIGDADVAALADWPSAVAALRSAYGSAIRPEMVPGRTMARGRGYWLRTLSAISPSGAYMGCKLIAASPSAKRASYLIPLFDQQSMDLAALIDGNRITGLRTAATAAVAVDLLAPHQPLNVAILGSGFEARGLAEALAATRQIDRARVYSPTQANREKFANDLAGKHGIVIVAVATAEAAVTGANVVLCAARSHDETPILKGAWLAPGTVVVSVGSTLPEQREVDEETLARAALVVADMPEEVLHETGDALAAIKSGQDLADKLVSLADVGSGAVSARRSAADIIVYKSVGSALQDIVIAEMILERALKAGRFSELEQSIHTIIK